MTTRIVRCAGVALALLALASSAWSQQVPVTKIRYRSIGSVKGKDLYKEYCVQCHGEDGTGHGAFAAVLRVPAADLTTIASRNGGKFVSASVEESITRWKLMPRTMRDRSAMTQAMLEGEHVENAPVMPLFGPIFAGLYRDEIRDRKVRILNLVGYLKSLQVEAPVPPEPK